MDHWNRCDECGRFIAFEDFANKTAFRLMTGPDSEVSFEEYETLCKVHNKGKSMNVVLKEFEDLGINASFHYADDSCKEWGLAKRDERAAMVLFHNHPELQDEMKEMARGFLWSLPKEKKG